MDTSQTNLIVRSPSETTILNRMKKFFGLPKSIQGDFIDQEQNSWCM